MEAMDSLRGKAEVTRFKGLGEISPSEFKDFIGEDIRLRPVLMRDDLDLDSLLAYYMGKNTPARQVFIIENLKGEEDILPGEIPGMEVDELKAA